MNSKERFYATVMRKKVDRPAAWLGMPDIKSQQGLFDEYGVNNMNDLKLAVGDDFYSVELPYNSPDASAIYAAFNWYGDNNVDAENRTLTADGCFKDAEELEDLDFFKWPDPSKYIDREECLRRVKQAPKDKTVIGILWSSHYQDTCAAFGMETAMMNMVSEPELYMAVDEKIIQFYLKANEIFFESTKGYVDAILIGNDMGSQRGLMLSPEMIRKFILPGSKRLIEQAHSYGIKVLYHSCGSIFEIIPDLLDIGVDVVHPIQALAANMDAVNLKEHFGGKVSFCGGVDTQELLVNGSVEEVSAKVKELRELFPTGLIISPSHEAIMPDVPPKNIRAIFEEASKIY